MLSREDPDLLRKRFREAWQIDLLWHTNDGFIFEPLTSFDLAAEKFGKSHVLVGSKVDCRTLTFGRPEQIRAEIDASLAVGRNCPGWIFAVGNHIAPNVPLDNARFYFDYLRSAWKR